MDEPTARRLAAQEAMFRLVNERTVSVETKGTDTRVIVCECARRECKKDIDIEPDEWEDVRSRPDCFVVAPGHEIPAIEEVVERRRAFFIVRKCV